MGPLYLAPTVISFNGFYMGNIGVTMSLFVKYALGVSDEKCSRYGLMLVNSACCVLTFMSVCSSDSLYLT